MGLFAHATQFVVLPALAGFLVLLGTATTTRRWSFVWSGVLLGLAVLMKQHAIFFLPFAGGLALWDAWRTRVGLRESAQRLGALALGAVIPLGVVCVVLAWQGVLDKFYFWTFGYAREYVSTPLRAFVPVLRSGFAEATKMNLVLWLVAAVGVAALWIEEREAKVRVFLLGLLVASFLAVCPGFHFRAHYFIVMLPAVALLVGVAVGAFGRLLGRFASPRAGEVAAVSLFAAVAGLLVFQARGYLFAMTPLELSRARYFVNPFVEAIDVAKYIRERTDPTDRIAVLGSEPEIYFYADRLSATGHIYAYTLMDLQPYASRMQAEMIEQVESSHPKYLVYVQTFTSWLTRPQSEKMIHEWRTRYVGACYDLVGIADRVAPDTTRYLWDEEVNGYQPKSKNVVFVFRQKSDAPCAVGHSGSPARS